MTARPPSRSRTRFFKLLLFLLAGSIINIAVAWACALWSVGEQIYWMPRRERPAASSATQLFADRDLTIPPLSELLFDDLNAFGFNRVEYYIMPASWGQPGQGGSGGVIMPLAITSTGWPFYSLAGEQWLDSYLHEVSGIKNHFYIDAYHWAVRVVVDVKMSSSLGSSTIGMPRPLPLRPLILGFLLDTLFYSTLLYLLFFFPFFLRRHIRIARHQCPSCGYHIAPGTCAAGFCTECGDKIASRSSDLHQ